jgi:hypothetical protein
MSTNGTHASTTSEAPSGARSQRPSLDHQSVDERLEKLRETIRSWDWRAGLVEIGSSPVEALETAAPPSEKPETAPPLIATTSAEAHVSGEPLAGDESSQNGSDGAQPVDASADVGPVATAAPPMEAVAFPAAVEGLAVEESIAPPLTGPAPPMQAFTPSDQVAPPTETVPQPPPEVAQPRETVDTPSFATVGPATEEEIAVATGASPSAPQVDHPNKEAGSEADTIGTSWFGQEPEPAREPDGALRRLWSHPSAKLVVAGLAALVVVALVVGGIRLVKKHTASGGQTTTTVAQPASHAAHHAHVVAPISAAQLATYEGYASSFQSANVTATKALVKAGGTPTTSQVVGVVVAYRTAVNLYNYQLHLIQWPQSMQGAIETDHAQLQALTSFLVAFSSVAPTGVPAWLSQLNDRANSTQVADNAVRQELGLAASSAFP